MPSSSESLHCQYRYDPLDRLIADAPTNEPERQHFYCKTRLATEINGAISYSIIQHEDQLLAQLRDGDALEAALLATDQQRSVLQALQVNQTSRGLAYSPYGHRSSDSGLLSPLGFNGERPDPVTGWYLLGNGYRPFDPLLMRFTCTDNLSPFGKGGLNAYAYCGGEPINRTDSTGHNWFTSFLNKVAASAPAKTGSFDTSKVIDSLKKQINALPSEISNLDSAELADRVFSAAFEHKMTKFKELRSQVALLNTQPESIENLISAKNLLIKAHKKINEADSIERHHSRYQIANLFEYVDLTSLAKAPASQGSNPPPSPKNLVFDAARLRKD
ncbi:RHS repeat-associated core domain-containing protein [Pseudomonas sp. KK4]|uniref:RHS repeat-associated core domain-containing protein n=1 Tax=Pseudomonas sp. KK4 TaxID=1855729 RepID=UPI00097BBB25|nr:RHS repeat-associated core domain-containing protein [Pseudomonas sp. KK4]